MAIEREVFDVTINLADGEKVTLKFYEQERLEELHNVLASGKPYTTLIDDEAVTIFPGGITTLKTRVRPLSVSYS